MYVQSKIYCIALNLIKINMYFYQRRNAIDVIVFRIKNISNAYHRFESRYKQYYKLISYYLFKNSCVIDLLWFNNFHRPDKLYIMSTQSK